MTKNRAILEILLFTVHCLLFTVLCGCASMQEKERILAIVDGEPITEGDFKYALTISHRKEDLSSAGKLDLTEYIQKLVDDRLIIQEARKSGMDKLFEIQNAIDAYILRESVVRLHEEEIAQKVTVTEEEIMDYYRKNYERFTFGIIETASEEEIKEILERLKNGENFDSLAREYSQHPSKEKGGLITITKGAMPAHIEEVISSLKEGEISEVINRKDRYLIVKLIGREEAPVEQFARAKGSIRKSIRKQKENERSEVYLEELRKRSNIKIDQELLSSIKLDSMGSERDELLKDDRVLVEVNGEILTVKDFVSMAKPSSKASPEVLVNNWIDRKLVDQEALSRNYEQKDDLRSMIKRYEDQLLKNAFVRRIILPQIVINDQMLREYYEKHGEDFLSPEYFRIQQITVKTKEEAEEILNSLKQGADFTWFARRKSIDPLASKGGDTGWLLRSDLPEPLRGTIDLFEIGDISPVIGMDSSYRVVKLTGKKGGEVKEFDAVKEDVFKSYFSDQVESILKEYVGLLKEEARIELKEDEIRQFEEKFGN